MAEVREERGTYRAVHSVLVDSQDFTDLSDNAKLLFYTLRFCPENNLASIFFPFYPEVLTHRLKMDKHSLSIAFREVIDSQWIAYQMPILWIRNGLKFSPGISLENPKHLSAILKIIKGLPKLKIVGEFCTYYKLTCPFSGDLSDRLYNRLPDSLSDTGIGIVLGKGKGKEEVYAIGEGEVVERENLGVPEKDNHFDPELQKWLLDTKNLKALSNPKNAPFWTTLEKAYDQYQWLYFEDEIKKADAWIESNPQRRPTERGLRQFMRNWFNNAVDRGRVKYGSKA